MIDIQKLASLTGIHVSPEDELRLRSELESVISLLEKIKNYDVQPSDISWHDLLGLQTIPSKTGISDGSPEAIIANVRHPMTGHAIEVKAFVE